MVLNDINPIISPQLLYQLFIMGHGDTIVIADAHFPAYSLNKNIIRCDGILIKSILEAILPLFEIDNYNETPILMMDAVEGDNLDPEVEKSYSNIISNYSNQKINKIERYEFYKKAKNSFLIVMTSDVTKYGNILLTKGLTKNFKSKL
jgi:L-fucose mutarotase